MKYAWLVVNAFLQSGKFHAHYTWLQKAANERGIVLECISNAELAAGMVDGSLVSLSEKEDARQMQKKPDFVIFWDKDTSLAEAMEDGGYRLFNRAHAIALCDNKYETLRALAKAGAYRIPKSVLAPMTFSGVGYTDTGFLDGVEKIFGYPMVVKECYGSFGMQVFLAKTREELVGLTKDRGAVPFLYQEFIASTAGRDVRLQVVGERVVAAMERRSETDFRANITAGGKMEAFDPEPSWESLAVDVCRELGLDFGGVDILFGQDGEPVICEVNSNAHFQNIYTCTKVNVAEEILDYICREIYGES